MRNLTDGGVFLSGAYAMGTVVVSSEFGLDLLAGAYAMGTKYPERGAFESSGAGGARDGHLLTRTGGQIDATKRRDIYSADFSAQYTRPGKVQRPKGRGRGVTAASATLPQPWRYLLYL